MNKKQLKTNQIKLRRKGRVRAKISGTAKRPRLVVFRSLKAINAQVINDVKGVTLAGQGSAGIKSGKGKIEVAALVGKAVAEKAIKAGVSEVVFDKSIYKYHGRVKALADAAREAGLKF
jgi:large subunit ribosomal protein L18